MVTLTKNQIADKFWSHVEKTETCWLWTLSLNHGYGQMWVNGQRWIAPRLAWTITVGAIKHSRIMVCHRCDNPRCVRPDHLFLASQGGNLHDMRTKGRGALPPTCRGVANRRSTLTEDDVIDIRRRYQAGESLRVLGRAFHVNYTNISSIVRRKTWTHLK